MAFGGLNRTYRVYKPAGLSAAPLVVMLHGVTGNGEQAEKSYGWDQLADSAKFAVAYPDGVGRTWNGHGCCGRAARENIDDVGFITAMVGQISAALTIDKSRVYATGMSNGGIMTYALACNSGIFAAIGPDSATQLDACAAPHPTSVIHIHGTADRLVPYNGGQGASFVNGPSIADVNAFWRNVDQCGPTRCHHQRPGHHIDRRVRRQPQRRVDHHRGRPTPVARRYHRPRARGSDVARAERHSDHLALLRGPPCLSDLSIRLSPLRSRMAACAHQCP